MAGLRNALTMVDQVQTQARETALVAQRLNTSLNRRERKLISQVLTILDSVLDSDDALKAKSALMSHFGIRGES